MLYCSICSNVDDRVGDLRSPTTAATPCGHVYHMICLKRWCEEKKESNWDDGGDLDDEDVNCPLCNFLFLEEECLRLYPVEVEVEVEDQLIQTEPGKEDPRRKNILILDAEFQGFVRRILAEKWAAELDVMNLKAQNRRLQESALDLIRFNVEKTVKLQRGDEIIRAQSAEAARARLVQKGIKAKKTWSNGKKKRSIWWRLFKLFVHPGYTGK